MRDFLNILKIQSIVLAIHPTKYLFFAKIPP